jgi:hypothetical protein
VFKNQFSDRAGASAGGFLVTDAGAVRVIGWEEVNRLTSEQLTFKYKTENARPTTFPP